MTAPIVVLTPGTTAAHTAEQALVRLMPTDVHAVVGTGIVALTALMLWYVPDRLVRRAFPARPRSRASCRASNRPAGTAATARVSLGSAILLAALAVLGLTGPHDPLANLLPLGVWTVWWIGIATLIGVFGPTSVTLNPWSGVMRHALHQPAHSPGPVTLHERAGAWPGVILLLLTSGFVLADPAPDDPARLARLVIVWWGATLLLMLAVGERAWLGRGECFSMLLARFAALSPWQPDDDGRRRFGMPGRALLPDAAPPDRTPGPVHDRSHGAAVFCLAILGCGSFDGLADTFVWLDLLGVNPLAYPGRSAMIGSTLSGLIGFNLLLVTLFALAVLIGTRWAGSPRVGAGRAFDALAPCVLPIAFAYHASHYLGTFLVNAQYALVALGDPLGRGTDPFGLGPWFVSTGFFNTPASVALIWFAQAGAVVAGHALSVLLAHRIALDLYGGHRRAFVSQLPLVGFMLGYTLFGLWLLAAPRGA